MVVERRIRNASPTLAVLTCLFLCSAVCSFAGTVFLDPPSPASIVREHPGTVQVTATGVQGANITLRLYVDVDGDGIKDPEDAMVWVDVIEDNVAELSPNPRHDTFQA